MDTAAELYRAGDLTQALKSQTDVVRSSPTDLAARFFMAELLCLSGQLERADVQLETIHRMDAGKSPRVAVYRQLIRAEKARREVWAEGRAPEFVVEANPSTELTLRAGVVLRAGDAEEASRLVEEAEEARPARPGTCDGEPFDDFRDLDDLTGGVLEILTSTGRYMWVPTEHVNAMDFDAPSSPLDLLWRPAQVDVNGGPEGTVYLPTIYVSENPSDAMALGRVTEWDESTPGIVRGQGLRTFLVGDEVRSLMELGSLSFATDG